MEDNSNRNKIIVLIVILVIVLGGGWYFFSYRPAQEAEEKARLAQIAREEAERKKQEEEAQKKARYEDLIAKADAALAEENWESAQALYAEAAALLPGEPYAKDQLALVRAKLEELEARKAGTVETLASPTGRFHVIVSSSVDGDLAMDYAKKLAKQGQSVNIIPPGGANKLFHRVSVGDYPSWDQAVAAVSSFSSMGEGVWVLKY